MHVSESVELLVGGARLPVPREAGVELFDRNRRLLAEGRVEVARVALFEQPRSVLHVLIGVAPVGLIEQSPPPEAGEARSAEQPAPDPTAEEAFLEFDDYL